MKLINVCYDLSKNFPNYKKNLLATIKGKEECDIHQILHRFNDTLIVRCNDKLIKISIIDETIRDIFDYITECVKNDGILLNYLYNFSEQTKNGFLMQEMNICSDIFRNYRFTDELEIIDGIKQIIQQLYKYYLLDLYYLDLKGINIGMINDKWYFIDFESFDKEIPQDFEEFCTYPYATTRNITDRISCEKKKLWFYYIYALIAIIFEIILKKENKYKSLFNLPKTYNFHNLIMNHLQLDNHFSLLFSYNDMYYKQLEQIFTLINHFINILAMLIDESTEFPLILDLITKI
jgi:hypothetical protein